MSTVGIGMTVVVLLMAASVSHAYEQRNNRELATEFVHDPRPGVAPLQEIDNAERFRATEINGYYVHATGSTSPVPPGLSRLPGPGEIVLSPALASLLASPDGALLRPRFTERMIGTISQPGLGSPTDLTYYAGVANFDSPTGQVDGQVEPVYGFGQPPTSHSFDPVLLLIIVPGAVALLVPILIFLVVSSRIAGAQRDRRLAALRLVGAGSHQVRRIAAAESLPAAALGLVLGTLLFLVARQLAGGITMFGVGMFTSDVVPSWSLVIVVVLLVPTLAVGSALFALRRTIIEPLGVFRSGKPVRRRGWWRLALVAIGIALLLLQRPKASGSFAAILVAIGVTALLIGVPVLLPWLLERAVGTIRGGRPSWQLAVRRLQLDSGTPARVIGGVAVVLASAVALQTLMFAVSKEVEGPVADNDTIEVTSTVPVADQVAAITAGVPGVSGVLSFQYMGARVAGTSEDSSNYASIYVASCPIIQAMFRLPSCADGQVFNVTNHSAGSDDSPVTPGTRLDLLSGNYRDEKTLSTWTVPPRPQAVTVTNVSVPIGGLLVTPGAIAGVPLPADRQAEIYAHVDRPDTVEYVRNALAPFTWQASAYSSQEVALASGDREIFNSIRNALLAGSLFTLLVAGVSMLVLALEQVRERRRPLAALAATGVPRAVLARSLLWQTMVPVLLGAVVALVTGVGLAALIVRLTSVRLVLDWASIGIFSAAAIVLVLLVTALTMPALRGATRLTALRSE